MPGCGVGWVGVGARFGSCFCSAENRTSESSNHDLKTAPAAARTYKGVKNFCHENMVDV